MAVAGPSWRFDRDVRRLRLLPRRHRHRQNETRLCLACESGGAGHVPPWTAVPRFSQAASARPRREPGRGWATKRGSRGREVVERVRPTVGKSRRGNGTIQRGRRCAWPPAAPSRTWRRRVKSVKLIAPTAQDEQPERRERFWLTANRASALRLTARSQATCRGRDGFAFGRRRFAGRASRLRRRLSFLPCRAAAIEISLSFKSTSGPP